MILGVALGLGIVLGLIGGGRVSRLEQLRLRHEGVLLAVLVVQLVLPFIRATGPIAKVLFSAWLATYPILIAIAVANRRQPGMWVIAAGLALNFVVIGANLGMPVSPDAAVATGGTAVTTVPPGDFAHVLVSGGTRLVWLADVLPVPKPLSALASAGDVLLAVGAATFLAGGMIVGAAGSRSRPGDRCSAGEEMTA